MAPKTWGFNEHTARTLKRQAGEVEGPVGPGTIPQVFQDVGGGYLFLTPIGGIPAATGTAPNITPGYATCTRVEYWLDGSTVKTRAVDPTDSQVVYNIVPRIIAGSKVVQTKIIYGKQTIDVEPCS